MRETRQTTEGSGGTRLQVTIFEADSLAADAPRRAVLLLHGWANAGRVWRDFADALLLADPDLRLFAPDLRGYGDSDKPATGYDCATFADDAVALASSLLGDAPWSLVGHSMSGKVAQIVASRQPAGLKSLVLLTPTPLKTEPLPEEAKEQLVAARASAEGVRAIMEGLTAHGLRPATLDWLVEDGLRVAPEAWDGWVRTMRDEDASGATATIAVPTLVVAGGNDTRTPPTFAQAVTASIAGARCEMLPGSGHLPHLEEPNALAALVVNFLDGSLPPTTAV